MVSWPGTIKPAVSDFSWAFWDFMPTIAELAGATPAAGIDGISIVPTLMGSTTQTPKPYLFWTWPGGRSNRASPLDALEDHSSTSGTSGTSGGGVGWRLEQSSAGLAMHVQYDTVTGVTLHTREYPSVASEGYKKGKGAGYGVRTTDAAGTKWKGVVEHCGQTGRPSATDEIEIYNLDSDPFEKTNVNGTEAGKTTRAAMVALLADADVECACFQC